MSEQIAMAVIRTFHVPSPLETRCFDWVALYLEEGEIADWGTLVGHGVNEWDAIWDLIHQDLERAEIEGYYEPNPQPEFAHE